MRIVELDITNTVIFQNVSENSYIDKSDFEIWEKDTFGYRSGIRSSPCLQ